MRRAHTVGFLRIALLCVGFGLSHGQDLSQIASIAAKSSVVMEDLGALLPSLSLSAPDADAYLFRLSQALSTYDPATPLTKGKASRVACAALGLRSSALYLIFPTERYAFRALVMEGVFKSASSPGEAMGGMELLDFINSLGSLAERSL